MAQRLHSWSNALQHSLLALLAAAAVSAFSLLGHSLGENLTGESFASRSATPTLSSRSEAFSPANVLRAVGSRLRRATTPASKLDIDEATKLYDISPLAVRAIETSPALRTEAAHAPLHNGKVIFEAPNGNTFTLYRPVREKPNRDGLWALIDVDNVVSDFTRAFGDEAHALTGASRNTFPRNNRHYDMREAVASTQRALANDRPRSTKLQALKDWLGSQEQLEPFLRTAPTAYSNYSLLHRYFIEQGFYARMPLLPGAQEGVALVHEQWPIRVVTKRYGTGPDFTNIDRRVPVDSARWISRALGDSVDSLAVMGGKKIDFAGNVYAVFEDNVMNIADIRIANAPSQLRERAFASGIRAAELDDYLARNNVDVLGIVFRWNYNKDDRLLEAMNVVAVDRWSDAAAVALAHHKLLTDPEAGASGRLHWSEVPGLVQDDGTPVQLPEQRILPD